MHFIIIVELFYLDLKILECGMLWVVVTKKWVKIIKLEDAIKGHKIVKIDKVLLSIRWESCIMLWDLPTSRKLCMLLS
jgi:hypothetical protein